MYSNPIHKPAKEKTIYPVTIQCIVSEYNDSNNELIDEIREHTNTSGALFVTRLYDSRKYSVDRDFIEGLPAFHAFIDSRYVDTFYPSFRPPQHITEYVDLYLNIEKKKREQTRGFGIRMLTSLFQKPSVKKERKSSLDSIPPSTEVKYS